jgi:hypothetical protein
MHDLASRRIGIMVCPAQVRRQSAVVESKSNHDLAGLDCCNATIAPVASQRRPRVARVPQTRRASATIPIQKASGESWSPQSCARKDQKMMRSHKTPCWKSPSSGIQSTRPHLSKFLPPSYRTCKSCRITRPGRPMWSMDQQMR